MPRLAEAVRSFVATLASTARSNHAHFLTAFEACSLPLFITTEDGAAIIAVNAATVSASGWPADYLRGKSMVELEPDGAGRTSRRVTTANGGDVSSRHVRLSTARGDQLRLRAHSAPVSFDGSPCLLTAVTSAHTDPDEGAVESQRLEAIGTLTGGIAHEFNNLLTVMHGHLEALAHELGQSSPLLVRVNTMRRAVADAAQITSGLLTFAGRNPAHARCVDLNRAITELVPIIESTLGDAVTIEWALAPGPATALISQRHVAQLLLNLALSVRDALPAGGRLVISTERASLPLGESHASPGPGQWNVLRLASAASASATTSGVAAGSVAAPGATATEQALSICRDIVEQCGGHLYTDWGPGPGANIRMFLPWVDGPAPPASEGPVGHASSRVILVVEDEADVRDIVAEILRRAGHTVHAVDGLASAHALLQRGLGRLDLLLTDIVLPGGNGLEVARRVRAAYPDLPVLYMSGYAERVFDGGASVEHLLQKPFTSSALLDAVSVLIRQ